jgi:hypothetical protein
MQNLDPNIDPSKLGACILLYGDSDSGKTTSFLTLEDPSLHINTQSKDARTTFAQFKHGKKITPVSPEGFDDLMDSLNRWVEQAKENKFPFKSVMLDDLTFSQSSFRFELEDDRHGARILDDEKKTGLRGLTDRFRFEKPDWRSIGSMMSRITYLLNQFSKFGIVVVATAIATHDTPRYGGGVKTAPNLEGFDYTRLLHGYFDFIGYIIQPFAFDENMEPILPRVSFHCNDGTYMARCNSIKLAQMGPAPLDFTKIIKVIRGG